MKKRIIISALTMLVFLRINAQEGEIYYKDYNPDTCKFITWSDYVPGTMDSLQIDINNDGLFDMWITGYVQHGALLPITFMSNGWELCYPDENSVLDSDTLKWENYDDWVSGCFNGKYGFRLKNGDKFFYGWMLAYCDMRSSKSILKEIGRNIYVDKMAFCTIPNYPLHWGQTSLEWDVDENKDEARVTLHPNPTTGLVTMGLEQEGEFILQVFDANGKRIVVQRNNAVVTFKDRPAGLYHIVVEQNGQRWSRKIIKM